MTQRTALTAQTILDLLAPRAQELRHLGARRLGLFGSFRRGSPGPDSDLDFLVALEQPSFDSYMAVKFYLEDLFECPVDLVLESELKPRLRTRVLNEVIYVAGL